MEAVQTSHCIGFCSIGTLLKQSIVDFQMSYTKILAYKIKLSLVDL